MTWGKLLEDGRVDRHRTSKGELDDMRAVVARNLADAALPGLSADNKLGLAYEAAMVLGKMVLACSGYRPKGLGHHRTVFEALPLAMGREVRDTAAYFERCRRERNFISYEAAGVVNEGEAGLALREAHDFAQKVEMWIAQGFPAFGKTA